MTGTALHTNEILQYLVLDKIVITFTAKKKLIKFVLISTWISVIYMYMRICDVLINFFVSVYEEKTQYAGEDGIMQLRNKKSIKWK